MGRLQETALFSLKFNVIYDDILRSLPNSNSRAVTNLYKNCAKEIGLKSKQFINFVKSQPPCGIIYAMFKSNTHIDF